MPRQDWRHGDDEFMMRDRERGYRDMDDDRDYGAATAEPSSAAIVGELSARRAAWAAGAACSTTKAQAAARDAVDYRRPVRPRLWA